MPAPARARFSGFPTYNFVGGHNDGDSLPLDLLQDAATTVIGREGKTLATYGLESGPQGYRPLREFIAGALAANCAMTATADDILVTGGSLQALDLVNEALLAPGDTVIVEEASYGGAISRIRRLGVKIVPVALDDGGIVMDDLARVLADLKADGVRPKFIYTIPTIQNPTGTILSTERRREMLRLARKFDTLIFEDDCYADLVMTGDKRPPALHALDEDGRVIYCGSFSKSIAPAVRIGYVIADWTLLSQLLSLKTDGGSGALDQMILAEFLRDNFAGHVDKLNAILKEKRDTIADTLAAEFGTSADFRLPDGGIFIWVTLPDKVDTNQLFKAAWAEGVAINPGSEWSVEGAKHSHRMRLCFGHPNLDTIKEGVAKLADICHREFGVPLRSRNVER